MRVALIAAVADNGIIGLDNDLPWRLPADFKHFKRTTRGHHVIMGRRTWESRAGKPLPKRINFVISSQVGYEAPGARVFSALGPALEAARAAGETEAFVIGGTRLYAEALGFADRFYLTRVHAEPEGDTRFPDFELGDWVEVERVEHPVDERHPHAFTILTLDRAPT